MLCSPCLASDWVEEGAVQTDEAMLRAPLHAPVNQQDIQTPETTENASSTDLVDFTPGYPLAFGSSPDAAPASKALKAMTLPMAFADTELHAGFQPVGENVSLEFRMDRLEMEFSTPPGNGRLWDRLNGIRKKLGLVPVDNVRRSFPDDFINAIGRGVTGGAKAGGKVLVGVPVALAKGTGQALATPGVPELLMVGAILGIAIPLAIQAGKNNGGAPIVYGFADPHFVNPNYQQVSG